MSQHVVRRLRPYLFNGFERSQRLGRLRSFTCSSVAAEQRPHTKHVTHDHEKRVAQLESYKPQSEWYPRITQGITRMSLNIFCDIYGSSSKQRSEAHVESNEIRKKHSENKDLFVQGKVQSVRTSGSKLVFVALQQADKQVQITLNFSNLESSGAELSDLKAFAKNARKGDSFSFVGRPHTTRDGEVGFMANKLPTLLSPLLHQIPARLEDESTRAHHRHVDMLVDPAAIQTLRMRDTVERAIVNFLRNRHFMHVRTPILQSGAGGAVARPFETEATELQGEKLNMRIAPELWLKRLIIGGADRIFEMGPVFRNEGVDATHNPEFTICEFYKAYCELEELMGLTEAMLVSINQFVDAHRHTFTALKLPDFDFSDKAHFARLEFIPTIENAISRALPDLSSPSARTNLLDIFTTLSLPIPAKPSLPRLLDALASHYIEPLCTLPTFITNHPAALSPLAKHHLCPTTSQIISARAELFIAGREIANMYEEENSPFAQREKFEAQIRFREEVSGDKGRDDDGEPSVDESYLAALEWGMPPTGGWGCGVDRLVMLFSGRERLGDVLAFGGLRNVVGAGRGR